jgi:predicted FMN-binding regulatory protein PaiB
MYINSHFRVHPATSLAFAAARGFGLVIAADDGRPVASHLPFRLIEADGEVPKLEFHVARANPLGAFAEKGGTWLVAVQGHDAYVSPDWYASADQVPTWLYEAVHLSGPVRVIRGDHTRGHTERLSDMFEKWLAPKPKWTLDKVCDKRRETLLKAIVAVELTIETIEGNFKLNQHKSDADHTLRSRTHSPGRTIHPRRRSPNAWSRCGRHWTTTPARTPEAQALPRWPWQASEMATKAKIGVLGASGYTGADAVRLLARHPNVEITALTANTHAGKSMNEVFPHFFMLDLPQLVEWEKVDWTKLDAVFCGLPHGTTHGIIAAVLAANPAIKVIDMSADFRLHDMDVYAQ